MRVAAGVVAKKWLAERGYDPAYGARPLRRLIQKAIGDELAKKLLAGETRDGDTVRVDVAEGDADQSKDLATEPGLRIYSVGNEDDES